jgi:hypothetical protein
MNIPIWPGSCSFSVGSTPFGFYDYDFQFQNDSNRVAKFCAQRLGYPIVDIELQDINFWTAFEESVTTYGNELYAYNLRENFLSIQGSSTGSSLNHSLIVPNMGTIIRISEQYGVEAGTGGNVTWRSGSLDVSSNIQEYDLNSWASSSGIANGDLEIKRIFYESPPAITKYFDPYAGTNVGTSLDQLGFGSFSPAMPSSLFLLMPMYETIERTQAIEFNDQIRKSQYSFELINNRLKIFPIPHNSGKLWFQYILKSERNNPNFLGSPESSSALITNVSNAPYNNPIYSQINSIGRQWIFEYTLALCKEMLGYIRGKYSQIPIPNSEVTLNQADLITAADKEKTALIDRLRAYLDETSRDKLLEKRAAESDYKMKELQNVPFTIYIG